MNPSALIVVSFIASLQLALGAVVTRAETTAPAPAWNFDREEPGTLPSEFSIGTMFDGRPAGDWQVLATDRAKSPPHVLAQLMAKGAEHAYKITLVKEVVAADLNLEVSFLPIQGRADMGGGLIWRATDDRNYYLARANPLEQNIRVYRVEKGIRHLLENFNQTIDVKRWHTLRVTHQGCRINVYYDDKQALDLCEKTFHAGMIGLWTKSDAVTYFDNLHLQHVKSAQTRQ
ncbi:MAG: Levanase [Nitrospira sp.]|nr:Levanase [Nitrospira sp.]